METIQQENAQEALQENNLLEGSQTAVEAPRVVQLVQSPEALAEIAETERRYREMVERENR